jgi:hypothetical protein
MFPIWAATPYKVVRFIILTGPLKSRRRFLSPWKRNKKRKGSVWMMNGPGLYAKRHNLTYTITKETKMYSCNSVISLSHRVLDERENLAIRN